METVVDGQRVVMSGTAITDRAGELRATDGKGTHLTLTFDQTSTSSQSGGALHTLTGQFPVNTPGGRHVYGFGVGDGGKMHTVRVAVEDILTFKIVTYTVTADF